MGADYAKSNLQGRHGGSSLPPGSIIATADSQAQPSARVGYLGLSHTIFRVWLIIHSLPVIQVQHFKGLTIYIPPAVVAMEGVLFPETQQPSQEIPDMIL